MKKRTWFLVILAALFLVMGALGQTMTNHTLSSETVQEALGQADQEVIVPGNPNQRIAVLNVEGVIAGQAEDSPLASPQSYRHEDLLDQIDLIKEDKTVKALLLVINSPGGGVYESDQLYRALADLKEARQLPIYVSQGPVAASGGYMISMVGDKVFADINTTTGSIGVISQALNAKGFMDEHGFKVEVFKSGGPKDAGAIYRDMTDDEKKIYQSQVNQMYDRFVSIVDQGRPKLNEDQVRKLADGRTYTGQQAKDNGLVDELGFKEDALAALQSDLNLGEAMVVDYSPKIPNPALNSLLPALSQAKEMLAKLQNGGQDQAPAAQIEAMNHLLESGQAPRFYYLYGGA
ncbi:hypothetical protein AWM75_00260 [Aerococcus urinaehominis]|uniref:Uncharacterized protein n=1 Tax=Aerococcus urinaehominis TaxID=128944 RepID=A0A109RH99_9LACT|nr:signal peptide peptidase SppA [Aerococcus urinaehominis]AMB98516.1 hypothetical protein AWM75_00260 [Aerococcus urinaehominis]SDL79866.1 protease-4 [Aerococcus urinaehominis]